MKNYMQQAIPTSSSKIKSTPSVRPRGAEMMLPHGGLPESFPMYLAQLIEETGGPTGPIGLQFVSRPDMERKYYSTGMKDPLIEDEHEVAPGLVYKYTTRDKRPGKKSKHFFYGRALWTITRNCAAYCRFCTRGREVGIIAGNKGVSDAALANTPHLTIEQIDETLAFIENEPNLNEIILSGGDPLTVSPKILHYVLGKLGDLQRKGKLSIVRIGTRAPIHNPIIIRDPQIEAIKQLRNPRMMIHINHPSELTEQSIAVLNRFRGECLGVVMSQTVLLKGVNDDVDTLYQLFMKCAENGIVPYYVFQNDAVYWAKHFTVPLKRAIKMWQELRPMLSGVAATARFVIDVANGYGKIPVPEGGAWNVDYDQGFKDFHGTKFKLDYAQAPAKTKKSRMNGLLN
jgi:lysine 2,3-aminomutase